MFCALRAHWTTDSYDYFKYQGKVRVNRKQFDKRNDKFHFTKLARLPDNEFRTACAFMEGASWIGDVTGELGADALAKHKRYVESCSNSFRTDLNEIKKTCGSVSEGLYPKNNAVPRTVQLFQAGKIGLETLVILDDKLKVTKGWTVQYPFDPLIKKLIVTIRKYRGFFSYKPQIIDKILVDSI